MIVLLDTNVVSELSRPTPDPHVERFIRSIAPGHAWISAITLAELNLGIALMPEGRKKEQYEANKIKTLKSFGGACAPFDALAAGEYASVVVARKKIGRPIGIADAQIAAIAVTAGLTLATRNVKDFEGIERLKLIDPWA